MKLLPLLLPLPLLLLPFTTTTATTTTTNTTNNTPGRNCTVNLDSIYRTTAVASTGITQLGIKLFQEFAAKNNVMVSPYSVWSLLALLLTGAEGHTEEELRVMLGVSEGKVGLLSLLRKLEDSLESSATTDSKVSLDVAQRIYVQKGFLIKKCHKELSDLLDELDLGQSEPAANTINAFVNTTTGGLIPEIVSPDMLGPDTRMVALNAIYFKGSWTTPFPKKNTSPRPFYVTPGIEPVIVDTMYMPKMPIMLGNSHTLKARVVQLSYSTGLFSMTFLLPNELGEAGLSATIDALKPTTLWEAIKQVHTATYDISLPKFEIKSEFQDELKAVLQKMGINDLFTAAADLSSFGDGLYVKHIMHKAFVKVDEEGTKAAAATGGVIDLKSKAEIHLNRPFLFLIHDKHSILFIGAVRNPNA